MSNYNFLKFCPECKKLHPPKNHVKGWGYIFFGIPDDATECKFGHPIQVLNITVEDYCVWSQISDNPDFYDAMIKLHDEDIIAYETKMAELRIKAKELEEAKAREKAEKMKPRCPKCGSTSITAGQKGYSLLTGFLGNNKTVNRCANCGYTWKP